MVFSNPLKLFLVSLVTLGSCKNNPKQTYFEVSTDLEIAHGWINQNSLQNHPQAFSGHVVSVLDSASPYGIGYREVMGRFNYPFNVVELTCYVRSEEDLGIANLEIGLDSSGVSKHWSAVTFDSLPKGKWEKIQASFPIRWEFSRDLVLSAYVMSPRKKTILADDFNLKIFIE